MDSSLAGPGIPPAILRPVDWSQLTGVDLHAQHHSECNGGDFFDALATGHRVLFLLTDIAGSRPEVSGVAAEVQTAFRQRALELFEGLDVNESDAVAALAHAVNLSLIEAAHGVRFAPTFLACFNTTLGILTYCNAGGLLALFRESGKVRVLESSGMPLGLFTHPTFEAVVLAFRQGDTLLLVTKGVIESRQGTTKFGVEGVEQLLRSTTAVSASAICDAVLGLVHAGKQRQHDDLTALAIVRREPPA